jgi:hypothetical protein
VGCQTLLLSYKVNALANVSFALGQAATDLITAVYGMALVVLAAGDTVVLQAAHINSGVAARTVVSVTFNCCKLGELS